MTCKHPSCRRRAEQSTVSVFALCPQHVDALFSYVNRAPVPGRPGETRVSRIRYRGAVRRFGHAVPA